MTAVAAASATGAIPIPFSDAILLIPEQISMIAAITIIFGIDIKKKGIIALLSSTLGCSGSTIVGKSIVSSILKLITGIGWAGGAVISATTAATLTAALGEAYIGVMEMVFRGEMSVDDIGTKKGRKIMNLPI